MAITRNRRAGVEDRWKKADGSPSAQHGRGKRWRARYVDDVGREHARSFTRKTDAQTWLDETVATLVQGTHVSPRDARVTVQNWCDRWIVGYGVHREGTVRQARTHIAQITEEFGSLPLQAVRPSMIKSWTARLRSEGMADSYVYALHQRLSQIMSDAVHDKMLPASPCSRRTSPPMGKQQPYLITTEQLWALHDAVEPCLRVTVLLGAFAGLRIAEVSVLRTSDVDFARRVVHPVRQWPDEPLKTAGSDAPIPVPRDLTLLLSASVQSWPSEYMATNGMGEPAAPWFIQAAFRRARAAVPGLPAKFSHHDLRHYLASLLISSGADIKTVQARLRHASAKTTLDVYGHLWPDADESTRAAVGAVIAARMDSLRATAD